jgi:hypothetical protein
MFIFPRLLGHISSPGCSARLLAYAIISLFPFSLTNKRKLHNLFISARPLSPHLEPCFRHVFFAHLEHTLYAISSFFTRTVVQIAKTMSNDARRLQTKKVRDCYPSDIRK